jgi:hypothetical protein
MNISIITAQASMEVPINQPVGLTQTHEGTSSIIVAEGQPNQDLVLYRPDARSVAVIASPEIRSLSVNGQQAHAGLARVENTAVITAHAASSMRFGILFSDEVLTIPAGASCDICGKTLTDIGKSHCRKTLCSGCIDVFGGSCPDCRKNLTQSEEISSQVSELQEFLLGEPQ